MTVSGTHTVIVGAGIIGLAQAVEALRHGHRVTVLDRDDRANGASIRNFGHLCISAQPARLLDLAYKSREGWLRTAKMARLEVQRCGTLVVARTESEMEVLTALEQAPGRRQVELISGDRVRDHLDGLPSPAIGGAWLADDLRADPRRVVGALSDWLASEGVDFRWRTTLLAVDAGPSGVRVRTSRGELSADRAVVCVGHDLDDVFPELAEAHQVTRCRLAMTRVRLPRAARIAPAVLTGTSMTRYGAFTEAADVQPVRDAIAERNPELVEAVANVMATQAPDGTLLVGDSHEYDSVSLPFQDEAMTQALLVEMVGVLGVPELPVVERWQGVYADSSQHDLLRAAPAPGVDVVTVTAGVGMTLAFGIAAETFAA